jgi:hypothetical protein
MNAEFNALLPVADDDRAQLWIIGTCDQVIHLMNECYVRKLVADRAQFTPIIRYIRSSSIAHPFAIGSLTPP